MSISDETIHRATAGERASQQLIYEQLSQRVARLVRRIVGPDAAEDVTQDVFVNVFTKMHSYKSASSFATWVYRLAVNDALQYLRRQRKRNTQALDETTLTNPVRDNPLETRDLVEVALRGMDEQLRIVLQLKEVDQLPYEQIAEIMGIPVGTVGSRLNKARRELRDQLQRLGWEG